MIYTRLNNTYRTVWENLLLIACEIRELCIFVFSNIIAHKNHELIGSIINLYIQVTPTFMNDQWPDLDWYTYYNIWERLSLQSKHVAEMVGVKESFLARAMQNRIKSASEEQKRQLRIHRRFYAALILQDFCNEVPIKDVSK